MPTNYNVNQKSEPIWVLLIAGSNHKCINFYLARLLKNYFLKNAIFTNPIGSPGGKLWDELRIDWNAT